MRNTFGRGTHRGRERSSERGGGGSSRDHFQYSLSISISKIGKFLTLRIFEYDSSFANLVINVSYNFFQNSQDHLLSPTIKDIECGIANYNYRFALTGQTWQTLQEYYPDLVDRICVRSAVFARMSSDQKQQLIVELMRLGYYVGTYIHLERVESNAE